MIELSKRPATTEDVSWVASRLREADLSEVKAACNLSPYEALLSSFNASTICESIYAGTDKPFAIYGVVEVSQNVAAIWMLGTDDILKYAKPWLRQCRKVIDDINNKYALLYNYVDSRNELHIKWLRWVGFTFIARHENYGYEQRLFYEIVRVK